MDLHRCLLKQHHQTSRNIAKLFYLWHTDQTCGWGFGSKMVNSNHIGIININMRVYMCVCNRMNFKACLKISEKIRGICVTQTMDVLKSNAKSENYYKYVAICVFHSGRTLLLIVLMCRLFHVKNTEC